MASKKLGCPLSSIFQQWAAQQHHRQQVETESHPSLSSPFYRILFQTSYSLKARITAAEPVENPHLYKRAGLATPSERAIRDIHGAGETAWLLHLFELAVQRQKKKLPDGDVHTTDTGSIIFLTTETRSRNYSLVQELPQEIRKKVQVIDIGSQDPFGWDISTDDGKNTTLANINNLQQIYQRLEEEFNQTNTSGTPVILIWQSLTPLIVVHGFQKVLRLLCALPTCLQIWPVNLQVMTPKQHAQLEDASNAILYLQNGEMNIIRQGIRERGNILRQKLPFRLEAIVSDRHKQRRFRIVEEAEDEERRNDDDDDHHTKAGKISNKKGNGVNGGSVYKAGSIESSHIDSRSRGAHLYLEESDGGRNERVGGTFSSEMELAAPSRPRIYLEDDDPEFDDFDEEDPDDDLDL